MLHSYSYRLIAPFWALLAIFLLYPPLSQGQIRLGKNRYNIGCGPAPGFSASSVSVVSTSEALRLFNDLKKSGIEFNYPQGNCQDRAHMMTLLLKKKGFSAGKIWAFAPGAYSLVDVGQLSVADKNGMVPEGGRVTWGFHVAPVLVLKPVKPATKPSVADTLVLDPSIDALKPLPYRQWLAALGVRNVGFQFTDAAWYRFNSLAGLVAYNAIGKPLTDCDTPADSVALPSWFPDIFTGSFYQYTGPARQEDRMAQGLALIEVANTFIQREAKPLLNKPAAAARLHTYQQLVGNFDNFEKVFRYGNTPASVVPELTNDDPVIAQYRQHYALAVTKWKAETAKVL